MKSFLLLIILLSIPGWVLSQDVIVTKIDESEIKCTIISITDTSLSYKLWNSTDLSTHSISKAKVLSYFIDQTKTTIDTTKVDAKTLDNFSIDGIGIKYTVPLSPQNKSGESKNILGPYNSGEISDGYIILENGDSIFGFIQVYNVAVNQFEVSFKESLNSEVITYQLKDLTGYGYNNLRYFKIKSPIGGKVTNYKDYNSEYLFLHLMIDGEAKLYRLFTLKFKSYQLANNSNPPFYSGKLKSYYVITNPAYGVISTKGRTLKGAVNRIFNDDIEVMKEVYKNGVDDQTLPDIVKMYNKNYKQK